LRYSITLASPFMGISDWPFKRADTIQTPTARGLNGNGYGLLAR
jgi:hypothetical protein